MSEEQIKELLFSLSWLPHSSYHSRNVRDILKQVFPHSDFEESLEDFKNVYLSEPCEGSPK